MAIPRSSVASDADHASGDVCRFPGAPIMPIGSRSSCSHMYQHSMLPDTARQHTIHSRTDVALGQAREHHNRRPMMTGYLFDIRIGALPGRMSVVSRCGSTLRISILRWPSPLAMPRRLGCPVRLPGGFSGDQITPHPA